MQGTHDDLVKTQFGPRAKAYVESSVHAQGADLEALKTIAEMERPGRALDLGCGGGHVSYLLASHAKSVVACDFSKDMLAAVEATASERGLTNIRTEWSRAQDLPFDDASFDFVACRYSVHHWDEARRGLMEARRVLQKGKRAVFIDGQSPASPLLDTHLQAVELLRDVSHVRDYSLGEWSGMLEESGFRVEHVQTWRLRMDFEPWTARMQTPDLNKRMIQALQAGASRQVKDYFEVEADGSFLLPVMMIEARAF